LFKNIHPYKFAFAERRSNASLGLFVLIFIVAISWVQNSACMQNIVIWVSWFLSVAAGNTR
jgi:hypothetical protein